MKKSNEIFDFKENELLWDVHNEKGVVAKLFLDTFHQIKALVFFSPTEVEKKRILELCCNHVYRFIKCRFRLPSKLPIVNVAPVKSKQDKPFSVLLMDFIGIDGKFKKVDEQSLIDFLKIFDVPVINGKVCEFEDALKESIANAIGNSAAVINYELKSYNWLQDTFTLKLSSEITFFFWNHASKYEKRYEDIYLHLIPPYHPANQDKESLSINGDTDAYISGIAVESIYAPEECRTGKGFGTTWSHVNHPFFATGNSFEIAISRTHFLSQEGMDELTEILKAALGTNDKYVGIIGGFNPPYRCPHNRLNELNLYGDKRPYSRGSEADCVWEYKTLESEGKLEETYIPAWFFKEHWLEMYEGAKCEHGIY